MTFRKFPQTSSYLNWFPKIYCKSTPSPRSPTVDFPKNLLWALLIRNPPQSIFPKIDCPEIEKNTGSNSSKIVNILWLSKLLCLVPTEGRLSETGADARKSPCPWYFFHFHLTVWVHSTYENGSGQSLSSRKTCGSYESCKLQHFRIGRTTARWRRKFKNEC